MLSLRDFWRRHKRKVFVSVGVLGSGYVLYKLYVAHKQRHSELEREIESRREADELVKAQLQTHFENVQRISDSTTLPHAVNYLRSRISEELDLSQLIDRLIQGKGQPNNLTPKEKLELWEKLKILSFTRTSLSLWAITILSLYIRVQVNILGRHLYIDTARGLGSSQDEDDPFDKHDQQAFLSTADYLSNYGTSLLIPNMQRAAAAVLKEKQLRDPFNMAQLRETIMQVLESFMSIGDPDYWVTYLVPENASVCKLADTSFNESDAFSQLPDNSKLEQLMTETRAVLSSPDFRHIMEISLEKVVDVLMEDMALQEGRGSTSSGVPLARLLPPVAHLGLQVLEEPSQNRFILAIRNLPEVELFFTLLYANTPLFF